MPSQKALTDHLGVLKTWSRPRRLCNAWLLALLAAASLSGCISRKKLPDAFQFTTHISDDGFKLFQLSFPAPQQQIRLSQRNERQRQNQDNGFRERYLERMLEVAQEQYGYCRDGYFLLGRYAGETSERLRGECKEKASEADRERFRNTLTRW